MEQSEHIDYWLKSAAHDLESAETLFQHQRYDWCLFLGHLVIEKVIKAFFVRDNPKVAVPQIHKLAKLAERTKLQLTPEQQTLLVQITEFNIQTRYPDYKFEFYKKCTLEFAQNYFAKIKELYQWLLQQM
jgi:HEPN domain-containing protein